MKQLLVLIGVLALVSVASAQPASHDAAMKQAEQLQKQYGGAATPGARPGMPGGAPGGMPDGVPPGVRHGAPGGMPGMPGAAGGAPAELEAPITLSDADVTSFVKTMGELKELGIRSKAGSKVKGSGGAFDGIEANAEAMRVLESNGFSAERFQSVTYSVAMAMAGLEMKGKSAEIAAARAQQEASMAEMKKSLTPEQYEVMSQHLGAADKMLNTMQDQPPQNFELVEQHRAAIDAVIEDPKKR